MDHIRGKQCQTERDLAIPKGFPVAIYSSHSDKNRLDMEIYINAIISTANNIVVSKTHKEKILLTTEDSLTDESNPSCSKLPNKNETQPSKADAVQDSLCSQTLVAEDMKFVCESVVDTDNVCEEDPPSLVPSEENPIETIHHLGADTKTLSKTSVGTEETSTEYSLPIKNDTSCNDIQQANRPSKVGRKTSLQDGMTGFCLQNMAKGKGKSLIILPIANCSSLT